MQYKKREQTQLNLKLSYEANYGEQKNELYMNKFISPQQLINEAKTYNMFFDDIVGFAPSFSISSILKRKINGFKITSNPLINYGVAGLKID